MSVLLQSIETAQYVEQPSVWTKELGKAREFGGATEALFYCCEHNLTNMQILGQFADAGQDFTIPLNGQRLE